MSGTVQRRSLKEIAEQLKQTQQAADGRPGVWPNGEPQTMRDAYDRQQNR